MSHPNARLTVPGRRLLVERVRSGRPVAHVADEMGISRRERKLGPARIGPILGLPASTVHRMLTRHGLSRLSWMDRPTGQIIRRYERARPGELIHVDIKKPGNIPNGGGHRSMLRQQAGLSRIKSGVGLHEGVSLMSMVTGRLIETVAGRTGGLGSRSGGNMRNGYRPGR